MRKRRNYDPNFRAKVVLEAIKGLKTLTEISSEHKITSNLITKWKKEAMDNFSSLFGKDNDKELTESRELIDDLYKTMGKMKMENEYLKKKLLI